MKRRIAGARKSARKNEWARKRIERFLLRDAAQLRSKAASLDRLAAKLVADREAGRDPDRGHLGMAARLSSWAAIPVREFLGLDFRATSDDISERLFPQTAREVPVEGTPIALLPGESCSSTAIVRTPVRDAVSEAAAIVRQVAAGEIEIDWTKEPVNERERQIRAVILGDCTNGGISRLSRDPFFMAIKLSQLVSIFDKPASDLRAEINRVRALCEEERRRKKRQLVQDAIRRVDGF